MASILVVEDSAVVRLCLEECLLKAGYVVHCEGDGESAIGSLKVAKFDLILLDLLMPKGNGESVVRWLLEQNRSEKVVVFSAYMQSLPKELHGRVSGWIDKYETMDVILERVAGYLGNFDGSTPLVAGVQG